MSVSLWMRILRASLLLYPRWFVNAHGEGLSQSWADVLGEAANSDRSVFRTGIQLLLDSTAAATRVRLDSHLEEPGESPAVEVREGGNMRSLWIEMTHAFRSLRRSPGFTAAAVSTMALGIGANAAIFTVAYTVLVHPLPYEEPGELVWLANRYLPEGSTGGISAAEYFEYRQGQNALTAVAAISTTSSNLTGLPRPLRLQGMVVSPGYFSMLGVAPAMGRAFLAEEEQPGSGPVVVLGDGLWRNAFGADPGIVGESIELDGTLRTVVGVMPRDFQPPGSYLYPGRAVDFWRPVVLNPATFDANVELHNLQAVGRLAVGTDPSGVEVALRDAVQRLEDRYPGISNAGARDVAVVPLREHVAGDATSTLLLLGLAVALVLIVACVNVTNLLIARGEGRASETAVRAALGASRGRQFLHAISESVLIGVLGGLGGIGLIALGYGALEGLVPSEAAMPEGLQFGGTVIAVTLVTSVAAGLLAGLLPAVRLVRERNLRSLGSGGGRGALGSGRSLLKHGLVIAQVAGAVVLIGSAGLLLRSLANLRAVEPGFDSADLLMVQVNGTRAGYPDAASVARFYGTIEAEVSAFPGVEGVTSSWQTPLQEELSDWPVQGDGTEEPEWRSADPNFVSPSYFRTYRIPVLAGRTFEPADTERTEGPIVLSRTAARVLWGNEDPAAAVGRRVNLNFNSPVWREVIGVVEDVRVRGLGVDPGPQTYMSFGEGPFGRNATLTLTARTRLAPQALHASLTDVLGGIDLSVPVGPVHSMEGQLAATMEGERLLSVLLTTFGVLALVLGATGVYGLMAYTVQRRTREIGLRLAVGARPEGVLRMIVRQGMILGIIGLVLGVAGVLASSRLLEGFLFGIGGTDAVTLVAVAAAVLFVTAVASFAPAWRAARVDPVKALSG